MAYVLMVLWMTGKGDLEYRYVRAPSMEVCITALKQIEEKWPEHMRAACIELPMGPTI